MDQGIASTLAELQLKMGELERALRTISEPAPAAVPAGDGLAPHDGRIIDEALEVPGSAPAYAQPGSGGGPGPTGAAPRAPAPRVGAPTAPQELLRFRERLERTASELTHEYDELLGRLSYAAMPSTPSSTISFARGAPSLDIVDVDGLRDAAVRAFESDPGGTTAYGTSIGYPRLRNWIAEHHGVAPERVLVTNGSMQADAFLFEHLVRSGDEVIVERPTYDRTLLSLRERGARIHPVELQPDGIDVDALAQLLGPAGGVRPTLAHIIPNFQNPAGYTLSVEKRQRLLQLAGDHGFLVFEDDPYVALRFGEASPPTMLSLNPEHVVYASSFSKTVCPGIRVGYLVGPEDLIAAITKLATNTYISPNMVAQSIVYEFCASGAIERSIETVRAALAERAATLAAALRRELPEAEFVEPQGGYFMWVTLPEGTDVATLFEAAAERGVAFVKGTDFMLEGGHNALRLAYSGVTPEQIETGVSRLAEAYRSL
ncbi:MAG TPA: PLP-dependent aminotransferase family protein [Solirubrobacteraceae bacterium]|nr:PLP-dependent aminotransferase family protein [Solirubrobacteraceae bacterium]